MPKGYRHLTAEQRYLIGTLKSRGKSHRTIAKLMGVSSRTVDREVLRNTGKRGYRHKQAEAKALQRKRQPKPHLQKLTPALKHWLEQTLCKEQWSPMQLSKHLAKTQNSHVSHERIYQWIWEDKRQGGTLHNHLRRRCKPYAKRDGTGKTNRGKIKHRVSIDARPAEVLTRQRLGDIEADLIMGLGNQGALVSLVDRKSRYLWLVKVADKQAKTVANAIVQALKGRTVHTLTFDNGKEFAHHYKIAKTLKTATFFADPYASWQRGTNENTNGLVRQYFPKKTNFATISDEEVAQVAKRLNNRPRECLDFHTPYEVQHLIA